MGNDEALNDFRRRYEHTFVWLALEDKREETLVYVDQVEYNESKIGVLHLTSEKYGTLTINLGSSDYSLQFRYPPVGVFQHGTDALVFYRKPARGVYRRGICPDNSSLFDVTRYVTGASGKWDHATVQSAFDHKVSTLKEALGSLEHPKTRSVALRNNFAISKSMVKDVKDYYVWHWTQPIAQINGTKVTKLLEPAYEAMIQGVVHD